MMVDNVFCFILLCSNFPNQITTYNVIDIFENLTMIRGALTWGKVFGPTMHSLLIIEPFS